jgi:hypothetical protein
VLRVSVDVDIYLVWVQAKEYAMSLKQRLEESNKIDEAHIFLDLNDKDDSMMPPKSVSASNTIIAKPTRTDEYS